MLAFASKEFMDKRNSRGVVVAAAVPTSNRLPSSTPSKQQDDKDPVLVLPNEAISSSSSSSSSTPSIPMTNHIQRTESELRLCQDEAMAEYRDHCMYNRIVHGMMSRRSLQQQQQQGHAINNNNSQQVIPRLDLLYENGACIENIMRTRREHDPNKVESLHSRQQQTTTSWTSSLSGMTTAELPATMTSSNANPDTTTTTTTRTSHRRTAHDIVSEASSFLPSPSHFDHVSTDDEMFILDP